MVKILGIADIIATFLLFSKCLHFEDISHLFLITFAIYLLLKGFVFLTDIGSIIDILGGILLILSLFIKLPCPIFWVVGGFLGLKGFLSLFA
jgi:uncharacterized membrane protein